MAFCLPFSTALTLLFSAFGVLFGLLGFDWSSFKQAIRHPISILCLALFSWLALSMLWSIAPPDELMEGISKYRKLLYVPLVAMLLISTRVKPWFLMNFFVVGCLVVSVGSLSSSSGLLEYLIGPQLPGGGWGLGGTSAKHWFYIGPPEAPTFGRAWVAQGAFLALAATYLIGASISLYEMEGRPISRWPGISLGAAIILLLVVVLNIGGRSGYFLLFFGAIFWVLTLQKLGHHIILFRIMLGLFLLFVVALTSIPRAGDRLDGLASDVVAYHENGALTSQGLRLRFWEAGVRMGLNRPISGYGVGSYAEAFSRDGRQPPDLRLTRPQPHSEFVIQFVQGGLPALLGLILVAVAVVKNSANSIFWRTSADKFILAGLSFTCLLLLIDGLFNSIIWDLAEGHAFVFLMASLRTLDNSPVG